MTLCERDGRLTWTRTRSLTIYISKIFTSSIVTIHIYFRHRIMLEDYVICKMPIQAPTLVNISQQPQSLLSPWSLILPLLIVVLLCIIIIYHIKCTMKCSSYLSNLHLPLKLDEETSVWIASQAPYLLLFHIRSWI